MKLTDRQLRNFWKKVNKVPGGCWEWTGFRRGSGYGGFQFGPSPHSAHRISFLIHHGHMPVGCVMHTCDNRLCVNPSHLRDGTQLDNMQDMKAKGRAKAGQSTKRLPEDTRAAIMADIATSTNRIRALAKKYQVDATTIRHYRSKLKPQ